MFQRLPTALAHVKVGNRSEKSLTEIVTEKLFILCTE